jgi:hypothetical protein
VTYNTAYLTNIPGSLTISPRPITVTAAASNKIYDATTVSTATPAITSGSLAYSDTAAWTESYDNRNAGANHVMTPSGVVNDGNGGKNYIVTPVTINTGVILKAPLTVTAATNTKSYDGNTSAAAVPTVSGLQGNDTVTGLAETYDTANAGTGKPLSVSAYTVNDGNSGGNYTVTLVNTTGIINKANASVTFNPYSVTYDGTAHTATGTAKGVLGESLAGLSVSGTTHTNAGDYPSDPWIFTDSTGNYNNTSGTTHDSITPAPLTITADNKSVGDDSPTPPFTVTYKTLMGTDTPASLVGTLVCTTTRKDDSPLGNYPITCYGQSSTNYTITYVSGVLTVVLN